MTSDEKNATLARAMGWMVSDSIALPPGSIVPRPLPAFDTDAAANRQMCDWLAGQPGEITYRFEMLLIKLALSEKSAD